MDKYNINDWVSINITKIASKWFSNPTTNHGVFVRAVSLSGAALPLDRVGLITSGRPSLKKTKGPDDDAKEKSKRPFLVVLLNTQHSASLIDHILMRIQADKKRRKRRRKRKRRDVDFTELMKETKTKQMIRRARINKMLAPKKNSDRRIKGGGRMKREKACRGVPFKIDFQEMNWHDWVMAPKDYVSQRCEGSCSFPIQKQQNATSHALIQSLQNLISGGEFPEPCCAPFEMSSLPIFLLDSEGNGVIKEYVDMKVDSCGCH